MAAVDFPTWLEDKIFLEASAQEQETAITTEFDSGHREKTEIFTDSPDFYDIEMFLDNDHYEGFRYWYKNIIANGQDYFNLNMYDGVGTTKSEVRFDGKPDRDRESSNPYKWRVTARLEVRDPQYWSDSQYQAFTNPGLFDWAVNGDWASNMDWIGIPRP